MSSERWGRIALVLGLTLGATSLGACKKAPAEPVASPSTTVDQANTAPKVEEAAAAQAVNAAPAPSEVAATPAPAPTPVPAPTAEPAVAAAPTGESAPAAQAADFPPFDLKVGDVVRDPKEGTPGWVLQQVLVASLDSDFERGWRHFKSQLHPDELLEKALVLRKEYNYPASRRKVGLFIAEKGDKPIYAIDRIVQEEGDHTWRVFLRNHSPDSMPTPCVLKLDEQAKKWRISTCSL